MGGDRAQMYFFFFKFATKSLEKKKRGGPVAPPTGDRPLSPTPGATIQWARQGGRSPLLRATGGAVAPPRATGSGRLYKASSSFPPLI